MKIADRNIGAGHPLFLVAEVGSTCNGDVRTAVHLIHAGQAAGLDAIKFQCVNAALLYASTTGTYRYETAHGARTAPIYDLVRAMEWTASEWHQIFEAGREHGIPVFATVDYLEGVDLLESLGCPAYKVCAWDLTYRDLIEQCARTHKPLLLDVGPARLLEVLDAEAWAHETTVLMVYAPHRQVSMPMMTLPGFSSPGREVHWDALAVGRGACLLEKRLTFSRQAEGHHHYISLEPAEMAEWVRQMRELERARERGAYSLTASDHEDRAAYYRTVVQDGRWKRR